MTEILSFVTTWIDLDNIVCGEVSPTEKHKSHYYFTYMWNPKNKKTKQKNKIKLILQRKIL